MKIHTIFIELFFMDVKFHDPGWQESRLIFMKIYENIFMIVYRIEPRVVHNSSFKPRQNVHGKHQTLL